MKKRSPNWEDLLTLAVLCRTGSYSAAARELGLTHATIGRRLGRLEKAVGAEMTVRSDAGFQLTKAGQLALSAAEEMERITDRLGRNLESDSPDLSGRVRITATETLGTHFLVPRLAGLHERHPDLSIELMLDSRNLSLLRRNADLAVRLARPTTEGLVTRRLGIMGYRLYVRREHPEFDQLDDRLDARIPVCRLDKSMGDLPESLWVDDHLPGARSVFSANSLSALHRAVKAGWGAGLLPCFLAGGDPELRALTPLVAVSREIWLAYPGEYRNVPRFRAVIDWLAAAADEAAAVLSGSARCSHMSALAGPGLAS